MYYNNTEQWTIESKLKILHYTFHKVLADEHNNSAVVNKCLWT